MLENSLVTTISLILFFMAIEYFCPNFHKHKNPFTRKYFYEDLMFLIVNIMIGAALTVYSFKFIFSYRNEWPLLRGFDLSLFPILGLMQFSHNLFVHTNIKLNFGYLNYVFISPHLHQFHHGAESKYHHKNYGVFLSIWDQMFGTFINEKNVSVNFGVAGHQRKDMVATILEPIRPSIPEN